MGRLNYRALSTLRLASHREVLASKSDYIVDELMVRLNMATWKSGEYANMESFYLNSLAILLS